MPDSRRSCAAFQGMEALRRGVFCSVVELQATTCRFIAELNRTPKPVVWSAHPEDILAAAKRGHKTLASIHQV